MQDKERFMELAEGLYQSAQFLKSLNEEKGFFDEGICDVCYREEKTTVLDSLHVCKSCYKAIKEGVTEDRKYLIYHCEVDRDLARKYLKIYNYQRFFENAERINVDEITTVSNIDTPKGNLLSPNTEIDVLLDGRKVRAKVLKVDGNEITIVTLE